MDMAIKIFLIYIGGFLACSIVFVTIAKKFAEGFAAGGKKPIFSGGFTSLVASGAAWLATYVSSHLFTIYWILAGIFMLFGILHIMIFEKKYFTVKKEEDRLKVFLAELLFCFSLIFFMIVVFSALQYFIEKDKSYLFFPMLMSSLAFFIPMAMRHTFEAAYKIPAPVFSTWKYPLQHPIELPDEKPNEKLLVIAFEISKKKNDASKTNFRAKAPEMMTLGNLYYHFINDYNDQQSETTIQYADKETAHEWWFRLKTKWYQFEEVLDPNLTFVENKIKENSIIICERI